VWGHPQPVGVKPPYPSANRTLYMPSVEGLAYNSLVPFPEKAFFKVLAAFLGKR